MRALPLLLVWLAACGSPEEPPTDMESEALLAEPVPLVSAGAWALDAAADPFSEHRPDDAECPPGSFREEFGVFEVQTGYCAYLSVAQPLMAPVAEGETVRLLVWHADLGAVEPGDGHLAVAIDGEVVFEASVAIPSLAQLFEIEWTAPRDLAAGSPVAVHLHNHGYNTWTIAALERLARPGVTHGMNGVTPGR